MKPSPGLSFTIFKTHSVFVSDITVIRDCLCICISSSFFIPSSIHTKAKIATGESIQYFEQLQNVDVNRLYGMTGTLTISWQNPAS